MGKILSTALRPIKSFNLENRAHRVIGREKPEPAPHHPANIQDVQRALEVEPDLVEKLSRKSEDLDQRLRDVFVTSQGSSEDVFLKRRSDPERPLPLDRDAVPDFDYGLREPDVVPHGKTTLRSVMQFLADHQVNPEQFSRDKIAADYRMKESDVADIIKYFKVFEVYIPAQKELPAQLAGPAQVRRQVEAASRQLEQESAGAVEQGADSQKRTV